ncbi:MAG: AAA family ATPase [Kluyvera sp.]|uniref:AAA family ATPase n=1 Tax=Kluyvera sp. TaxID=1538228 RepID=UPI003A8BAFF8
MTTYAEQLTAMMAKRNWSQGDVAQKIGMSHATISAFISGNYAGNVEKLTGKIINLINRENKKDGMTCVSTGFVMTETAKQMLFVSDIARDDGDISVICGGAGLGKTSFLMHYARENPGSILIETDPSFTARAMLEGLCRKLSLDVKGNMHVLTEAVIKKLQNSGRVLLVDEAELLPYRALEVIRRIHDKTRIGVVLVGLERLVTNLKGRRGEFLQLYSRVGCCLKIGNELPADDIRAIAGQLIDGDDDDLMATLYEKSGGNARRLSKLLRGAIRMVETNNKPVSTTIVREFAKYLID